MRVLYDHQIFSMQRYGGISRYFCELIHKFIEDDTITTRIALLFSNNHYLSILTSSRPVGFFPVLEFRGKERLLLLINRAFTILQLKKQDFDVFHPTYYDPYFLKYLGNKPFVLTVHDMTHEKTGNNFLTANKRVLVERAAKIIAISENTKKDIIEMFDIEASKIEVIYHGSSMQIDKEVRQKSALPKRYLLFVGLRESHKNFERFIRGTAALLAEEKDLSVVCVGGGAFSEYEIMCFAALGIQERLAQFDLDDEQLALCYQRAEVFVYPSLYEGFGIPILEAFACQCPLVCSNNSSFPEIAQDGAEYFDPYSERSIYEAITKVLKDESRQQELLQNGLRRLKEFSWDKASLETRKIYESVM